MRGDAARHGATIPISRSSRSSKRATAFRSILTRKEDNRGKPREVTRAILETENNQKETREERTK
jgi:hypothetical protein